MGKKRTGKERRTGPPRQKSGIKRKVMTIMHCRIRGYENDEIKNNGEFSPDPHRKAAVIKEMNRDRSIGPYVPVTYLKGG